MEKEGHGLGECPEVRMPEMKTLIRRRQNMFGWRKRNYSKLWMSRAHCDKLLNGPGGAAACSYPMGILNFEDRRLQLG